MLRGAPDTRQFRALQIQSQSSVEIGFPATVNRRVVGSSPTGGASRVWARYPCAVHMPFTCRSHCLPCPKAVKTAYRCSVSYCIYLSWRVRLTHASAIYFQLPTENYESSQTEIKPPAGRAFGSRAAGGDGQGSPRCDVSSQYRITVSISMWISRPSRSHGTDCLLTVSPGAKTGGSFVLDVTEGMGLRAVEKVRFVRGKARKSRWCEVKHRVIEWVSRSSSRRSSK
jgi:hypothetical protein